KSKNGSPVVMTVKYNSDAGLTEYFAGDGETKTASRALTYENVKEAVESAPIINGKRCLLCEYEKDSERRITSMNVYGNIKEAVNTSGAYETYYDPGSRLFNKKYCLEEDSVVFVVKAGTGETTVLFGSYPQIEGTKNVDILGYHLKDGKYAKALVTVIPKGGSSSEPETAESGFIIVTGAEGGTDGSFKLSAFNDSGYPAAYNVTENAAAGLTYESFASSLNAAKAESGASFALCGYETDKAGNIVSLNIHAGAPEFVDTSKDYSSYYNGVTKTLINKYRFTEDTLVFASNMAGDTVRVFKGIYPRLTGERAAITGCTLNADGTVGVMMTVYDWKEAQNTGSAGNIGYLKAIARYSDYYEYTIAYGGNGSAVLKSRTGDIDSIVAEDDIFTADDWMTQMGRKAGMITFDVSEDGTIKNMHALTADSMTTTPGGAGVEYLSAFMVESVGQTDGTITLRPLTGAYVNVSGKPKSGADFWSEAEVPGIFAEYDAGAGSVFRLSADAAVILTEPHSTNQAKTTAGTLSDLVPASVDGSGRITSGMVVTLAYNGETGEITQVFANTELVK
ncbi:MAG: hypothetical protein IIZ19_05480, partial [Clostridia bacterium]|nr:hypothetical protein [Clostridia bacterium]